MIKCLSKNGGVNLICLGSQAKVITYRHKYTKFIMGDANFRLVREMNGKFDPEDVALADGNAYFTKWALFKDYIDKVGDSEEVSTPISSFA